MKTLSLYIILLIGLVAASCDKFSVDLKDGFPVYISVSAEETSENIQCTKAPYIETSPSDTHPLSVLVLASTDPYSYQNTANSLAPEDGASGPVHYHTDATFTSSSEQLLNSVLYNSDQTKQDAIYFSALHPYNGWTITGTANNTNYTANYTFTGKEDVMFAPQTFGKYNANVPALNFKHLLSLINLSIYAENENVAKAWGNVTSIKIYTAHDMGKGSESVSVNLSKDYIAHNLAESSITFTEVAGDTLIRDFFYTQEGEDLVFPPSGGYPLFNSNYDYTPKKVGYVLLAPVVAMDKDLENANMTIPEFKIAIKTIKENVERNVVVNVDLMNTIVNQGLTTLEYFTGSTAGKKFDLTLKFTMGNTVAVKAEVTRWETGGYGVGDVEE